MTLRQENERLRAENDRLGMLLMERGRQLDEVRATAEKRLRLLKVQAAIMAAQMRVLTKAGWQLSEEPTRMMLRNTRAGQGDVIYASARRWRREPLFAVQTHDGSEFVTGAGIVR